jgi:hypothetical protein
MVNARAEMPRNPNRVFSMIYPCSFARDSTELLESRIKRRVPEYEALPSSVRAAAKTLLIRQTAIIAARGETTSLAAFQILFSDFIYQPQPLSNLYEMMGGRGGVRTGRKTVIKTAKPITFHASAVAKSATIWPPRIE